MTSLAVLRRAFDHVRPVRAGLAAKLALVLAGTVPVLLLPWPVKILIDHVIVGTPIDHPGRPFPAFVAWFTSRLPAGDPMAVLWWTVLAQGVLLVLIGAFGTAGAEHSTTDTNLAAGEDTATSAENLANAGWSAHGGLLGLVETLLTMRVTQTMNHELRSTLFARLLATPMPRLATTDLGDAVYRVMYDTPAITVACYRLLLTPIVAPIGFALTVGALRVTFGDLPELVVAAMAFLPLSFLVTWPFATALRRAANESRTAGARTTTRITDALTRVNAVQALGTGEIERAHFDGASAAGFATHRRMLAIGATAVVVAVIAGISLAIRTFLVVVDLVVVERVSLGDFALLFAYYGLIIFYVVEMGTSWVRLQTSAAGLARVFEALDAPGETAPPDPTPPPERPETVRLDTVSVAHPDGTIALSSVSLTLRRGELTVLVGPAGAGKTTLASLVPGFVGATEGRVLLDEVDVAAMDPATLRRRVAFAFQEPALLDGTIEENLRLGRPDATDLEIRRAARTAGLDALVESLPHQFATEVGRRGEKLSVGQRHRIGLARALLRDAPIVILDEPTAALDALGERRLVPALRNLARDRIVLVISHRLTIAEAADRVLVLVEGRLVEEGTPADLGARPDGAYRRALAERRAALGRG